MKDFREAAKKRYPDLAYIPKYDTLYYTPRLVQSVAQECFEEGANHGYSEAIKEHREFYLLVREYFSATAYLSSHAKETPERALRLQECQQYTKMILQHLQAFTDHEQSELPFKDLKQ